MALVKSLSWWVLKNVLLCREGQRQGKNRTREWGEGFLTGDKWIWAKREDGVRKTAQRQSCWDRAELSRFLNSSPRSEEQAPMGLQGPWKQTSSLHIPPVQRPGTLEDGVCAEEGRRSAS